MLSLIAIAKNEAADIARFLQHHQPLVDEIILVDTGSDDGTAALATESGAKVYSFPWCDDFAKARNYSLTKASGNWMLCLDIDEFIDPSDFPRLLRVLEDPPACYLLPQWNYYDQPQHQEWQPVQGRYPEREQNYRGFFIAQQYRLFPSGHGLQWKGRVHEDLAPAVARSGLSRQGLDVPIHHYGYVKSEEHNMRRNTMYGRLVRKKIDDNPRDWKANLELAYILIQEGRGRQAIPVLEKVRAQGDEGPVMCRVRAMLGSLYQGDGRLEDAIEVVYETVNQDPDWLFGWTDLIKLLIQGQHWEQVETGLKTAQESFGENPLLLQLECQFLIKTQRIVEAIPVARRVHELLPDMDRYARIADQCEDLARKEGLL